MSDIEKDSAVIVGGNFEESRPSGVVRKLWHELIVYLDIVECNGYRPKFITPVDLVIWMPEISNSREKQYPEKGADTVLICSKVMRKGYTTDDAMLRVTNMQADAVIMIEAYPFMHKTFWFTLMDRKGKVWIRTTVLKDLAITIFGLYNNYKGVNSNE